MVVSSGGPTAAGALQVKSLNCPICGPGSSTLNYLGEPYRHFQTATAATSYVLGEFPWQVRVGEAANVSDYISPPRVISSEKTGNEVTWSMGEYLTGRDIWKAFK